MDGKDIVIEERDALGHREVCIIFPPGRLSDGKPEGCYLGYGHNRLYMTKEHFDALCEKLGGGGDAIDALGKDFEHEMLGVLAGG